MFPQNNVQENIILLITIVTKLILTVLITTEIPVNAAHVKMVMTYIMESVLLHTDVKQDNGKTEIKNAKTFQIYAVTLILQLDNVPAASITIH